jgi:hypothetical protein
VIPVILNSVVVVLPVALTLKVVPPVKFSTSITLLFALFVPSLNVTAPKVAFVVISG